MTGLPAALACLMACRSRPDAQLVPQSTWSQSRSAVSRVVSVGCQAGVGREPDGVGRLVCHVSVVPSFRAKICRAGPSSTKQQGWGFLSNQLLRISAPPASWLTMAIMAVAGSCVQWSPFRLTVLLMRSHWGCLRSSLTASVQLKSGLWVSKCSMICFSSS